MIKSSWVRAASVQVIGAMVVKRVIDLTDCCGS